MERELIIMRLEMLVSLIENTEPDIVDEKNLFSHHIIIATEMLEKISNQNLERNELISIMYSANRIWKTRNKIKNGEWDSLEMLEVHETIEEQLAQGAKIAAIKYYRETMSTHFNEDVSLREAKDFVDAIESDMKRKKII
jgi:ribosomal protein L7/L12